MTMADKIVLLNGGRVEQVGSPLELYDRPTNLFVAGFIGSPRMNFLTGETAEALGAPTIGVRPEHLRVASNGDGWEGTVTTAEHLGSDTFLAVDLGARGQVIVRQQGEIGLEAGARVSLKPESARVHRFDAAGNSMAS
jgi:multiple sugar transport system ATP-binding protein